MNRVIRKINWILRGLRNKAMSCRYGIPFSKHTSFGKRIRIVNPQYIKWGGAN